MRPLAHLADSDEAIAFAAFHALVAPALRDAVRGPLRRARHAGRACHGPAGADWCADCEASMDDLLLASFTRLRAVFTGPVPQTRSGEPVRELRALRSFLLSPEAQEWDARGLAGTLRRSAGDDEPLWLRAARAQLVHYPLRHLEARIRRDDAVRRGGAARPDRDLRSAAWAEPLRADPVILDLLLLVVFRVRRGIAEPYEVPADLRERHGLDTVSAARRMHEALMRLRAVNPGFFAANIGDPATRSEPVIDDRTASGHGFVADPAAADPLKRLRACAEGESAREVLRRLVTSRPGEPAALAARRGAYRGVVDEVCAVGLGDSGDPVRVATGSLGLTPRSAARLIRRLVTLVAAAGVEWAAACTGVRGVPAQRATRPSR